jgi:hypothetical protein
VPEVKPEALKVQVNQNFGNLSEQDQAQLTNLSQAQARAVLLVKLVQILKLKKSANKQTVDLLVSILNEDTSLTSES